MVRDTKSVEKHVQKEHGVQHMERRAKGVAKHMTMSVAESVERCDCLWQNGS